MIAGDLRLPVEDSLGEEQVINRALNLLPEFPDLRLLKNCGGRARDVKTFLVQKNERQLAERERRRQISYVSRGLTFA